MHEKITKLLDHGLNVVVKNEDGEYKMFIPYKDTDGDYRHSGWFSDKERMRSCAGECDGDSPEALKEYSKNWQIVEYYRTPQKKFEVGEKVKILDSVKDTDDWENIKESFPNMIGYIDRIDLYTQGLYCKVYDEDKSDSWFIGAEHLAPYIEDEVEEVETIKIGNNTYNKKEVENALKDIKSIK